MNTSHIHLTQEKNYEAFISCLVFTTLLMLASATFADPSAGVGRGNNFGTITSGSMPPGLQKKAPRGIYNKTPHGWSEGEKRGWYKNHHWKNKYHGWHGSSTHGSHGKGD